MPEDAIALERLKRRAERERAARRHSERLLEEKSLELYRSNEALAAANVDLNRALDQARSATELNRRLAFSDALTGLPNRRRLFEWLNAAGETTPDGAKCALGLLHTDLDRLKYVNDAMGHKVGDEVLVAAAMALKSAAGTVVSERDAEHRCGLDPIVARLGGDEFVVAAVLSDVEGDATRSFAALGDKMTDALACLRLPDGRDLAVGASVGVVVRPIPDGIGDPSTLLADADLALYRSKSRGRGVATLFDDHLRQEALLKRHITETLPTAISAGELTPFYQVQVDARSGRIVGAEALVRWRRPDGEIIPPGVFLGIAEQLGLLDAIDDLICARAVEDLRRWRSRGLTLPKLSVNVSAGRLADPGLLERLAPPQDRRGLSFELLETMLLDDIDATTQMRLDAIAAAGVSIEIDDFGSGHASIVGLMRVRPSRIKLDRALVAPLADDIAHCEVLRSIVQMAKAMEIAVTAEGVETRDQARILREIGVDTLQGYFFSRPLPGDRFERFLTDGAAGPQEISLPQDCVAVAAQ